MNQPELPYSGCVPEPRLLVLCTEPSPPGTTTPPYKNPPGESLLPQNSLAVVLTKPYMRDRLATIDIGRKVGAVPLFGWGSCVPT